MERDVVCGMQVDPAKSAGTSEYNGKTYYFCSKGCKTKFDTNPAQYAKWGAPRGVSRRRAGNAARAGMHSVIQSSPLRYRAGGKECHATHTATPVSHPLKCSTPSAA